jgi:hypothetical protein
VAIGVSAYAAVAADRVALLVLALGLGGTLLLAYAIAAANPGAIVPAIGGAAAAWSASAWTRGSGAPGGTILAAAGIYVAAELAYWSLDQAAVADERELLARRAAGLAARACAALLVVAVVLAALGLHAHGGLLLESVGVLAAVGLLAVILLLARTVHRAER